MEIVVREMKKSTTIALAQGDFDAGVAQTILPKR
jgi:hypothetical protein